METKKEEVVDLKEVVSQLVENAEHFGAAGASIKVNYPNGWCAEVSVKRIEAEVEEDDEECSG